MSVKTSTGLSAYLAVTGSLKGAFDGGLIKVFDGTPPSSPDDAEVGTLLWTISVDGDGTGLVFDSTPVGRALVKPAAATWQGATVAGTPTYYRLVAAGDTGAGSTSQPRVQGSVGAVPGVDLYMTNPTLVTNANVNAKVLLSYSLSLPAE